VRPGEHIDEHISSFYAQVRTPVLTDLTLDFGDVQIYDVYPSSLPDLFAGSQLLVTGRYSGGGDAKITLRGLIDDDERYFTFETHLTRSGGDEFVPRLWAARKIGYLLTQTRLHGEQLEWIDAIIRLSIRFGIITPYTSFLIEEDQILTEEGLADATEKFLSLPSPEPSGAPSVELAAEQEQLRNAEVATERLLSQDVASMVKTRGSRTFLLQDEIWIDTTYDPSIDTARRIIFGSAEYYQLLQAKPHVGSFLALGQRVIFIDDGQAYEIVVDESGELAPAPTLTPTSPAQSATMTPTSIEVTPSPAATSAPSNSGLPSSPRTTICPGAFILLLVALGIAIASRRGYR
jgi:Ca-activated chloride channel family protein